MKKFVYLSYGILNKNLYNACCIDSFISNKIEVELLDLTPLLFRHKVNQSIDNIIAINSYKELENYFSKNDNTQTLYNIQLHYETQFFKLFLLLKKYNCKISIFEIGYLPFNDTNIRIKEYLKNPIRLFKRIASLILDKLLIKLNFINLCYNIRFVAGDVARKIAQKNSKNIVEINYIDYENNRNINTSFSQTKRYFVFLDIYLHKHPDHMFSKIGNVNNFSGDQYIKNLNNFFSKIEKRFNIEVVIAAHPRSNYDIKDFNGRKVIKNDTVSLVKNAEVVISHHSTSISFAILNKKPIVFIYDNSIKTNFKNLFLTIKTFAQCLNMPLINIDYDKFDCVPIVLESKYEDFKYNYLTTKNSEEFTNNEIIKGFIENEMVF